MIDGDETLAILAEGVSKHYRSFTAVDRLDLGIRRGEVFCLLGPNGSGKTTQGEQAKKSRNIRKWYIASFRCPAIIRQLWEAKRTLASHPSGRIYEFTP